MSTQTWAPIARGLSVPAAETAADARPLHEQLVEYEAYAAQLADAASAHSVLDAFQLLEARHGFARIAQPVYFAGVLIGTCEGAFVGGFERASRVEHHATPGSLVGLTVEQRARVHGTARLFPPGRAAFSDTSPHVTLADCELGTHLALALSEVETQGLGAGVPFAHLAQHVRVATGRGGWDNVHEALALALTTHPDTPEHALSTFFISLLGGPHAALLRTCAPWTLYWTRRMTR